MIDRRDHINRSSSSSSNLYFARVIPSIQTVLLSIGALVAGHKAWSFTVLYV